MKGIIYSKYFKKDFKRERELGRNEKELDDVIYKFANEL